MVGCVHDNVGCLGTLGALYDFEFDGISLVESTIAVADDGRVMNENVRPIIPPDKTIALGVVGPLHFSLHVSSPCESY